MFRAERSVLVSQLYEKITLADVKHFFSAAGKIQSLQLEFHEDSRIFKKSAIVEFENIECVLLALGLNGRKLKGIATIVQPIMGRQQLESCNKQKTVILRVENLKQSVSKEKLEAIFKPFGSLSLRIVSTSRDNYAQVNFDRINNSLAAMREVNDSNFGIVVKMM